MSYVRADCDKIEKVEVLASRAKVCFRFRAGATEQEENAKNESKTKQYLFTGSFWTQGQRTQSPKKFF
jgi:hypothetical protein